MQDKLAALKAETAAGGAIGGGTFVGSTTILKKLQEQNRKLTEENQRLQNKVLRVDQEPARAHELEEKYQKLLEVSFPSIPAHMPPWKTENNHDPSNFAGRPRL